MTDATETPPRFITVGADSRRIAVRVTPGRSTPEHPGVVWCGGFLSDMRGTKAEELANWGARTGRQVVRFDYSGHGESEGAFIDGTISRWLEDALAVFDRETAGPQIVVGSSMGGWIALLLARVLAARGETNRLAALVLIAPAPDFTEELMWKAMPEKVRAEITGKGVWYRESQYGPPQPITRGLIEDGRSNLVLGAPFAVGCRVRILQGVADPDVPWQHALRLTTCLAEDDVVLTLVKDGDHRLSRPEDIERILKAVEEVA
ncbi:alpha/beta hydrolase fold protein [Ancylobacter novellus DSM 506]|uniref:Alpha/beta hydrolase fold protein n=1 Tax=Ancylobacter novellus (strain ATCC 8093 / DSM 506 / JCM 20403 / CCM 1077 / IAM 12100 / NBRC 12443 / NCIMB 10456) TaxID=639283 RepID=D6ZZJ5_ANCN5|nr:alpha/beta hydrolase [Ancylobacter novellus]ADH91190.1 alpha/beta hydrolase fold protein [Ancylobacter novellus DSM 506]